MPANLSPKIPDRYYTRSEVDAIVAGLPVPDTSGLMPKAGGVFTGPIFVPKGNAGFGSKGINFGAAGDNTGLWMPGDGGVAIGDSGTTRLRVAADGIYPSVPIVGAYQPLKLSTLGGFPVVIGGEAPTGAPTGNATVVANPLWAGAGIVIPGNQSIAMGDGAGTNSSPTFGIVTRAAGWPVNFANANNGYGVRMIGDHGGANAALDVTGPVNIDGPLAATQGATVTGNLTVSGSYLSTGGGITIAGDQNVGGGINVQGSASFVQPIRHGGVADAGSRIQDSFVAGDSSFRHAVTADGAHYWGGGNTNFDTRLRRTAANTLALDDAAGGPANLALPFEGQLRFGDANHYIKTTGGYGTTYYDTNGHHFAGGPVSMTNPAFTTDLGDCTATARCNPFGNDGVAFRAMRGNDPIGRLYFAGDTGAGQHTYLDCNGGALTLRGGDGTGAAGLTAGRLTHTLAAAAPSLLPGQSQAWADAAAHAYTIDWVEADTTLRRKALVSDV